MKIHHLYFTVVGICALMLVTGCSTPKPAATNANSTANTAIIASKPKEAVTASGDSIMNVVYGNNILFDGKKQSLTMNIYLPSNRVTGKRYPLIMLMHGGGFSTGSKENMNSFCRVLADSGFVSVTINYRKGWDAGKNPFSCEGDIEGLKNASYRATQDANAALRFLVEKQDEYAIDKNWIFVGGSSAGAVMAYNMVYLNQEYANRELSGSVKALGDLNAASNNLSNKFSIKGICGMWGSIPDSTLVTASNAVPTILYHGTSDIVIPYEYGPYGTFCKNYPLIYGSATIYRRTIAAGKPAILNTSIGGKHGPVEFTRKIMMGNIICFFRNVMSGTAKSNAYSTAKAGCR